MWKTQTSSPHLYSRRCLGAPPAYAWSLSSLLPLRARGLPSPVAVPAALLPLSWFWFFIWGGGCVQGGEGAPSLPWAPAAPAHC